MKERIGSCLVLGGGIGGLALADRLSASGVSVTLVEKEPFFGGLCRRVEVDGSGVDLGPHVLRTKRQEVLDYWRELIGDDLRPIAQPQALMVFQGNLLKYPVKPAQVLRQLPPLSVLRCGRDLFYEHLKATFVPENSRSFEDWVVKHYGRSLYEAFFCPLTEKVWGVHPRLLDVEYARKRIPPVSLRQLLFNLKPKGGHHSEDPAHSRQHFPKYGVYQLCERILDRLRSRGVRVIPSTAVSRLEITASSAAAEARVGADGPAETIRADYVASSVPLPVLARMLGQNDAFASGNCQYRGVGFLYLSVPEASRLPACVIYCADREFPFNRVSDFSYFSREACAPGKNVICVEYHVTEEPVEEINARIIASLRKAGIVDPPVIHAIHNAFSQYVYPVYRFGYKRDLVRFMSGAADTDRLVLLGRQGLFVHANTDEVIEQAFAAAGIALDSPFDRARKNALYSLEGETPS